MPELAKAQRAKRAPLCGKMKRKLESAGSDSVAGSYVPNHFLIELTNQTPFINDSDTTDMEHFPVFMHEYWHYLHNITTISGFRAFVRSLEQLIEEFPDDIEAKAFLVWKIWDNQGKGLRITSHTAVDALANDVLAVDPMHPVHHYRIHLCDGEK